MPGDTMGETKRRQQRAAVSTHETEEGWDIFISHNQKAAEAWAADLAKLRTEACADRHWNALCPNKGGMKRGVESSDVFCLFLTKGLLNSYYVRLELSGQSKAKPIVLLYPTNELIKFSPEETALPASFRGGMFETMVWSSIEPRKTT